MRCPMIYLILEYIQKETQGDNILKTSSCGAQYSWPWALGRVIWPHKAAWPARFGSCSCILCTRKCSLWGWQWQSYHRGCTRALDMDPTLRRDAHARIVPLHARFDNLLERERKIAMIGSKDVWFQIWRSWISNSWKVRTCPLHY